MSEKMNVVAIVDERKAEMREVTRPKPLKGQVLIKIDGCALCTFEQRMFTRVVPVPLPFVGGHEFTGTIVELGEGVKEDAFPLGQRVAARMLHSCGHCYGCRHDEPNVCTSSSHVDMSQMDIMGMGGLAEYINADISQVYFMPNDMPVEKACFAEPLACVLNSIEKGQIEIGDDVVVIGGGIMGQLHVMCAKLRGARVIMSEPDEARREIAAKLGADVCINPLEGDPIEMIKELTGGNGAAVVFNTTAVSAVAQQAIGMVAKLGRVVMYSSQHPDKPIEVSPNWLHNSEAVITGAVSPSVRSFRQSVDALSKGLIDPELLVSGSWDKTEAQKAFEAAIDPATFRCIIRF